MPASCPAIAETARKIHSTILQAMARSCQARIAEQVGVNESAISRFKDGDLQRASEVLAACGLKVVPVDAVLYDRDSASALFTLARHTLASAAGPEDFACR